MDCPNIKQKEIQSRLIDVYWDFASLSNLKFDADLQIDGLDRTNLLNDIIYGFRTNENQYFKYSCGCIR